MLYYAIKIIISAVLIVVISEIAKRNSIFGALIASLPIISILAMIWLYADTKNIEAVSTLAKDIFWLVIPSLVFFATFPLLIKYKLNFYGAVSISAGLTILAYALTLFLLRQY